jgi:hypothetical protein
MWEDVLEAAELRGELAALMRQARQGLGCLKRLAADGDVVSAETLRGAAIAFRHEHNLLAADELEAWLSERGLAVADWNDYLRREILRERWSDDLERIEREFQVADDEVDSVLPAEAACSGFLLRSAERLAEDAALGDLRASAPDRAEVEHVIAAHALDWIRIEAETLELDDPDAAREAALCVRVDGRALADVAADSGAAAGRVVLYAEDAEPGLRSALVSASPGELVGPVAHEATQLLFLVRDKIAATADDPELERRAAAVIAARMVERELRNRVVWHDHP